MPPPSPTPPKTSSSAKARWAAGVNKKGASWWDHLVTGACCKAPFAPSCLGTLILRLLSGYQAGGTRKKFPRSSRTLHYINVMISEEQEKERGERGAFRKRKRSLSRRRRRPPSNNIHPLGPKVKHPPAPFRPNSTVKHQSATDKGTGETGEAAMPGVKL